MKWKRSQSRYGKTPVPETPYQKAGQVEDRRLGRANARGNRWCLAFCGAMGLAALSTTGLIIQSAQASIVPWVVEVDETGGVKAMGPAQESFKPSDAQIAHQLARFITNVRSVSIDPVVLRQNWLEAYSFTTDQASITLNSYAQENDPFTNIGERSVTVDVLSVVRSSDDSFELRWRETEFARGVDMGAQTYTASLRVVNQPPKDAETLHRNPLGLYVHGLNWSKDLTTNIGASQ